MILAVKSRKHTFPSYKLCLKCCLHTHAGDVGGCSPWTSHCCSPGAGPASGLGLRRPQQACLQPRGSASLSFKAWHVPACPCVAPRPRQSRELFPTPPSPQPLPQLIIQKCLFQPQTDLGSPRSPSQAPPDVSAGVPRTSAQDPPLISSRAGAACEVQRSPRSCTMWAGRCSFTGIGGPFPRAGHWSACRFRSGC